MTKVEDIVLHDSRVTCEVIKRFDQKVRLKLIAVSIKVTREGRCDVTCEVGMQPDILRRHQVRRCPVHCADDGQRMKREASPHSRVG